MRCEEEKRSFEIGLNFKLKNTHHMVSNKRVRVPTGDLKASLAAVDAACDARIATESDENQKDCINKVREQFKSKLMKIVVACHDMDAIENASAQNQVKIDKLQAEISAVGVRVADLRERVPKLAMGIVESESKIKESAGFEWGDLGITSSRSSDASFLGMKETMQKLEQNLNEVGRDMPEKMESLQTTIESVTSVLRGNSKNSTVEEEICRRENEDPQTKRRRRSSGVGTNCEKVFERFVSHVGGAR